MSNNLTFHPAPGDDTPHARAFFADMTRRLNTWADLLAACEDAYARLAGNTWHDKLCDQLKAAIDKAKGKSQEQG